MAPMTIYCVQPFWMDARKRFNKGRLSQFTKERDAVSAGRKAGDSHHGVVVYAVDGEAEFDTWSEPRLIASFGQLPEDSLCS